MSMLSLYFDDTGSRHPDKKSDPSRAGRDWFALGGVLVKQEDEAAVKALHARIVADWRINSPFHMTDMLAKTKKFSWLGKMPDVRHDEFWSDYKAFLASVPVLGLACVIDRPGYAKRGYLETHGANRWLLCRSSFDILVERAAKIAIKQGRRLQIVFEGDPPQNQIIKGYFENLRTNGLAFSAVSSGKYSPLSQQEFDQCLTTIEYKDKKSVLLQIADSYVYSMARSAYDKHFTVYRRLRDAKRIANFALPQEDIKEMGVKHYCFDA